MASDAFFEFVHQLARETVREERKRFVEMNADHLPVTRRRVLARRRQSRFSVRRERSIRSRQPRERLDIRQSKLAQVRKMHRPLPRNISERIASRRVAIRRKIRHRADSNAVQHDPNYAAKGHSLMISSTSMTLLRLFSISVVAGAGLWAQAPKLPPDIDSQS